MTTVLDPTSESRPEQRELVPRPESLDGLTIGLLDIEAGHVTASLFQITEGGIADHPVYTPVVRQPAG